MASTALQLAAILSDNALARKLDAIASEPKIQLDPALRRAWLKEAAKRLRTFPTVSDETNTEGDN